MKTKYYLSDGRFLFDDDCPNNPPPIIGEIVIKSIPEIGTVRATVTKVLRDYDIPAFIAICVLDSAPFADLTKTNQNLAY